VQPPSEAVGREAPSVLISIQFLKGMVLQFPFQLGAECSMRAFLGFGATMQNLYAVPWRNPARRTLVSFLVATILVFSIFALLKTNTGDEQAPAPKELLASNSVERPPVRSSASNDQMAAFLAPAPTQWQPVQSAAVDRGAVPLPRPRPKRL
jgi:hypothetical protein